MKETDNIRSWARGIKFLYTLAFPGLATAGLSHFQCVTMEEGSRWVRTSLSQECAGPAYESSSWVAGFALVQVFVPPLVIFIALWRSNFKHMKYFIVNYTSQAWFFELYLLYRKAAFVFIAVMMTKPTEQCFTATALMTFSLAFTAHVQPWVVGWINLLDCIGHMVIILCILIGITWCSDIDPDSVEATGHASVAVVSMIVLFAAALAILLLYQTCGKISVPLAARKRFSSMFSLDRRRSSGHKERNVGKMELPAADGSHLSGAVSLSASELLQELDAVDAESATDSRRNPLEDMKEIRRMNEMNRVSFSSGLPVDMAPDCPDNGIEMQDSKIVIDLQ